MEIKKNADLCNVEYRLVYQDIPSCIVFDKENACVMIEKLRFECMPILGCDVYRMKNDNVEVLLPNLYIDKNNNESYPDFLRRSCNETMDFIINYPKYKNDIFFEFVTM